jgi:hypothetical protein
MLDIFFFKKEKLSIQKEKFNEPIKILINLYHSDEYLIKNKRKINIKI